MIYNIYLFVANCVIYLTLALYLSFSLLLYPYTQDMSIRLSSNRFTFKMFQLFKSYSDGSNVSNL